MISIGEERVKQRGYLVLWLSAPFIYFMVIPVGFIDLATTIYQQVCFRLYRIPRVSRRAYVRFVPRAKGMPFLDRFNCYYCSYANGIVAYVRAVLIETEKYWCPLKYASRKGFHVPHPQERYAAEGDDGALAEALRPRSS